MDGERPFSLTDNAFAQLGTTPRASREVLEEELRAGGARAHAARRLLDMFERLDEELGWLPGVSNAAAADVLAALVNGDGRGVRERIKAMRGLAKANLAADAAARLADVELVEVLVRAWEQVDPFEVANRLSDDRALASLPPVTGSQVQWGLETMRRRHAVGAAAVLAGSETGRTVLLRAVERPGTASGGDQRMVDALVEGFEAQTSAELDNLEAAILAEVDALTRSGHTEVGRLDQLLEAWGRQHAASLRLAQRRGREDPRALALVGEIRRLYLDPTPGPQRVAPAAVIAARLQSLLPHSPAVQRMVGSDLGRLGGGREAYREVAAPPPGRPQGAVPSSAPKSRTAKVQKPPKAAKAKAATAAEAARERLVAQVRARLEAEGQAANAPGQKKKVGCGWIIPLLIGGFFLTRCVLGGEDEPSEPPTVSPPAAVAPSDSEPGPAGRPSIVAGSERDERRAGGGEAAAGPADPEANRGGGAHSERQ